MCPFNTASQYSDVQWSHTLTTLASPHLCLRSRAVFVPPLEVLPALRSKLSPCVCPLCPTNPTGSRRPALGFCFNLRTPSSPTLSQTPAPRHSRPTQLTPTPAPPLCKPEVWALPTAKLLLRRRWTPRPCWSQRLLACMASSATTRPAGGAPELHHTLPSTPWNLFIIHHHFIWAHISAGW